MIISHEHKFIFIRTRKTASSSLEQALSAYCGPDDIITPRPAAETAGGRFPASQNMSVPLRQLQPRDLLTAARKRQLPRHYAHDPADLVRRHVGEDLWRRYFTFTVERDPFDKAVSVYHWLDRDTRDAREPFGAWVQTAPSGFLSNFDLYTINSAVAVDFVGRYERLAKDVAEIGERIGLPTPLTLPETRVKGDLRSDRRHYREVFDDDARRRVEIVCAREIAAFGYAFDG